MLIIMSGSAGVGKNTIINELLSEFNNLTLMTTVSTRAMRPGEEQGRPYFFVTREEFDAMVERGEMLETCPIHGNMYGSSRKILEEKTAEGKAALQQRKAEEKAAAKQAKAEKQAAKRQAKLEKQQAKIRSRMEAEQQRHQQTLQRQLQEAKEKYKNYEH